MTQTVSIKQVYEKLKEIESKMVYEQKLSDYLETFEVLSNPETMKSIRASREDIKNGKVRKINSVKDMLDEL